MVIGAVQANADAIIAVSGWVLNAFATLMFLDEETHVELWKGALYATAVGVVGLAYFSLSLYWSTAAYAYGTIIWFGLAFQRDS